MHFTSCECFLFLFFIDLNICIDSQIPNDENMISLRVFLFVQQQYQSIASQRQDRKGSCEIFAITTDGIGLSNFSFLQTTIDDITYS
jgi:hypothetical protein